VGIREALNRNPAVTTGATIGLIVITLAWIVWQMLPARSGPQGPQKAFYTDDDGATYFADDLLKVPPFKREGSGKDAVRAHVYKAVEGTPFVAWMEKFKPSEKDKVEKQVAAAGKSGPVPPEFFDDALKQVKKKGGAWGPASFETMSKLRMVETKDGYAREIYPQVE
jgi:hypothetical protein